MEGFPLRLERIRPASQSQADRRIASARISVGIEDGPLIEFARLLILGDSTRPDHPRPAESDRIGIEQPIARAKSVLRNAPISGRCTLGGRNDRADSWWIVDVGFD